MEAGDQARTLLYRQAAGVPALWRPPGKFEWVRRPNLPGVEATIQLELTTSDCAFALLLSKVAAYIYLVRMPVEAHIKGPLPGASNVI